jgi:hypothetical protein
MADDPCSYLRTRFTDDAATLRARAAQLATGPAPRHGPDAAASRAMADACDAVVALLDALRDVTDIEAQLTALDDLGPRLQALTERAPDPHVRSVFVGAATRLGDIVTRERAAMQDASTAPDDESADARDADHDDD